MAPEDPASPLLGTVLVVGGCGFFGYHLVRHLLQDAECGPVHVLDISIDERNVLAGASYVRGSISDADAVSALVNKIQPRVVFHAASPVASLPAARRREFWETNVRGTQALLAAAAQCDATQALVYTSTVDAYAGNPPHVNVAETHPLWDPVTSAGQRTSDYNLTKAIADRLVLAANGPRLRTAALRPAHMYGERHAQGLYEVLAACAGGRPLFQVGDGANMMEVASADNTAAAHLLAAKALLDPPARRRALPGPVDGEAFNVSDGAPVPFWHHVRVIWRVARGEDALKHVVVIPAGVMAAAAWLVEWALWIFTLDTVAPPQALSRTSLAYCIHTNTFSIQKARDRLGYRPVADHDAVLEEAVRWELERRRVLEGDGSREA